MKTNVVLALLILLAHVSLSLAQQSTTNAPEPFVPATAEDKALAARAEKAIAAAEDTPGKEAANFIRTGWTHDLLLMLKGEKEGTANSLALARGRILGLTETAEKGPTWPRPHLVRVPSAKGAVKIDGKLDEPVWKKAAVFDATYPLGETNKVSKPRTVWRVMWDRKYLYFGFECQDTDVISPTMKRDDQVFQFDCVEMFILPEFRNATYWEIVVGPSGSVFDGLRNKRWNQWGFEDRMDLNVEGMLVGVHVDGTLNKSDDTDNGYTVEVAVPFSQLPEYSRAEPQAGQRLHFMLVRLDKNGSDFKVYAFQPELSWGHNIWNHAPLELVK